MTCRIHQCPPYSANRVSTIVCDSSSVPESEKDNPVVAMLARVSERLASARVIDLLPRNRVCAFRRSITIPQLFHRRVFCHKQQFIPFPSLPTTTPCSTASTTAPLATTSTQQGGAAGIQTQKDTETNIDTTDQTSRETDREASCGDSQLSVRVTAVRCRSGPTYPPHTSLTLHPGTHINTPGEKKHAYL